MGVRILFSILFAASASAGKNQISIINVPPAHRPYVSGATPEFKSPPNGNNVWQVNSE